MAHRRIRVRAAGLLVATAIAGGACAAPDESLIERTSASPLDPSTAARAALVVASCVDDAPAERRLEDLFHRVHAPGSANDTRAFVDCIAAHREGCRAVEACMAVTVSTTATPTRCEGEVAITDLGRRTIRVDCARIGRRCAVSGSIAECIELAGASCDANERPHCTADGRPVRCRGGFEALGPSCQALGLECIEGSSSAFCGGRAGTCALDGTTKPPLVSFDGTGCVGGDLEACVGGGRTVLDCGRMVRGAGCMKKDGAAYCGLGDACRPGEPATAACDGDSVTVCNGGRVERIDCKSLGFSSCVTRSSPLGQPYAACAEPATGN